MIVLLKKWSLVSFVLFIVVATFGCGKSDNNEPSAPGGGNQEPNLPPVELINGSNVYGYLLDESNNPISGVVVTDGFSVVKTNESGIYQFKKNENSKFVYYSTPAEYEVTVASGSQKVALFYRPLSSSAAPQQIDFVLKRRKTIDKNFVLFGIGDPQVANNADVTRFTEETLVDIQAELAKISKPVYGLSLGDVVADNSSLLNSMKSKLGSTNMTVFTTVGNHDKFLNGNLKTSNFFEGIFGPTNYSFDIGDVHFVCLDNVVFTNADSYTLGLSSSQIDWLRKDLSYVSKDKMLIVYYHMPLRGTNFTNRTDFFDLIKNFKKVHLMSGHTHYNENYIHSVVDKSGEGIFEHVHAATSGAWWKSTINGDGTPNGYMIYEVEGTSIKNWIYKPTKLSKDFQMRLHWGDISFGGQYGYFSYGQVANTLIANVWNADPNWKIEVFMNGNKLGDMVLNTSSPLNQDAWSKGYHLGVLNRSVSNYSTATKHLYAFKVNAPNNTLKVVATDRFGQVFEQTEFVSNLTSAVSY